MPIEGITLKSPSHSISSYTDCSIENGNFTADSYNLFNGSCKLNEKTNLSLGLGTRVSCKQTDNGLVFNSVPMAQAKLKYNISKIGDNADIYATERLRVFDSPIPQSRTMFGGAWHPNNKTTIHAECGYTTNFQPNDGRVTVTGGVTYKPTKNLSVGIEGFNNIAINGEKQYPPIISIGGYWNF